MRKGIIADISIFLWVIGCRLLNIKNSRLEAIHSSGALKLSQYWRFDMAQFLSLIGQQYLRLINFISIRRNHIYVVVCR